MKLLLRFWLALLLAVPASAALEEVRLPEVPALTAAGPAAAVALQGPPAALSSLTVGLETPPEFLSIPAPAQAQTQAQARPVEVQAFLSAARAGASSKESEAFVAQAPQIFDGLSPEHRRSALEGLHELAVAEPKQTFYRHALQRLLIRDELARVEPLLREKTLTEERREDVLAKTKLRDIKWYHHLWDEVNPVPEGIARREDLSIGLNVKSNWRKLPSFIGHLRTIFSHEYTHRLQFEGEVTEKYGMEIPPVAAEMLRGLEFFGLKGLREGMLTSVAEGLMHGFEQGRAWARKPTKEISGFYWKGFLAGAAYELAVQTGRWPDAWAFHRLVSSDVPPLQALEQARAAKP